MFHHWMDTDAETVALTDDTRLSEVRCIACGVVAPEWQHGAPYFVSVDHGPLPVGCPGPVVEHPHHLTVGVGAVECVVCAFRLTDDTLPADVDWECVEV
jgi:hypothetical protein